MALGDFNVGGGASQDVDKTLKAEGAPADAKAVGDALAGKSPTSHTHSNMTAATASTAGKAGFVPPPAAGAQAKYLRGDGTWQTPANTTYGNATQSAAGLMSAADKKSLDALATNVLTIRSVPSQSGSLTYNGKAQSPSWANYNTLAMKIGGTTSGTTAGSYSATFTPLDGYKWSDGTTAAKTVKWSIAKAAGTLSLSASSLALTYSKTSGTVTVTRSGTGAVSATSSNTAAATVSVSGETITVTAKANGSATITVNVAADGNYNAPASKTFAVSVTLVSKTLNDNSWATIKSVSDAGQGANYWAVGDTKRITLNGKVGAYTFSNFNIDVFILGFNHNSSKEGSNRIHFQIGKVSGKAVALCDSQYNGSGSSAMFHMNSSDSNSGGWNGSYMRKTLLGNSNTPASTLENSLMAALPSDLLAVMKTVTKYTDNTGGGSNSSGNVTATADYLFLLAEFEVFGTRYWANQYEQNSQKQYDYYKAGNSRVAYNHSAVSTAVWWWLRSANYSSGTVSATSILAEVTAMTTLATRLVCAPALPSNPPQSIWPHHAHGSGRKARTFPQKIQRARQRPARFLKMAQKCYHLTVF
jgi:hypothetical protein